MPVGGSVGTVLGSLVISNVGLAVGVVVAAQQVWHSAIGTKPSRHSQVHVMPS
jgi:hypothetical protein